MKVALGQTNSTVGDLPGNAARMLAMARAGAERGADVIVFPELSLTGYPPRDLLEKQSFLEHTGATLERLAAATADLGLAMICGTVTPADVTAGNRVFNS